MREIYGICVNNLTIDQKKLVRLMQDTIPDFPSDNESVYADYITDCKQKNIFYGQTQCYDSELRNIYR